MNRRIILFLLIVFINTTLSFAFDWKALHEDYKDTSFLSLEQAFLSQSTTPENQYRLGLHYLDRHKTDEAKAVFQEMLTDNQDNIAAAWGLAEAQRRQRAYKESRQVLEKLIKEHPDFVPAYLSLAYLNYVELRFQEALQLAGRVIAMEAEDVDLDNLARAHGLFAACKGMMAKRANPFTKPVHFFSMKKHLAIVQQLAPESYAAILGQASYFMAVPSFLGGDLEKAEGLFLKAIKVDPLEPEPYVRLAQIYEYQNQKNKARVYLDKAIEIDPEDTMVVDYLDKTCHFVCL